MQSFITRRTKLLITGGLVLVIALFLFTPRLFSSDPEKPKRPKTAVATAPGVATDVFVVKRTRLDDDLQTTGTLVARQEINLVSEVARKVVGIYAREGSFVARGTLLFKLDDADLLAKKKKLALQEKLALLQEKRFRELVATESVNQQEYDQVATALHVLQAETEMLNVDIAKTEIRAPFAGKLGLTKIDVGAYVTPATVLASLQDVTQLEINFTVPEKYAADVRPGQLIQFTTETSNLPFHGKIIATEPNTDLSTRSLGVKALSENHSGKLVPGSSAKIGFALHSIQDGIVIPTQALIPTAKGYSLFLFKNGKALEREIKTGSRTKGLVQVLGGLAVGDTVITTNLLRLGTGVPVSVASLN